MGDSPKSDIFWGILVSDDLPDELSEALPYEWGSLYLLRIGEVNLANSFLDNNEVAEKRSECLLEKHGSEHHYQYFVAIKASHLHGDWDLPIEIPADHLTVKAEWEKKLRSFCEVLGIPWADPKWYCVSSLS